MKEKTLSGTLLDDINIVTIEELTHVCICESEWIVDLVNEGILEPIGKEQDQWRFTGVSLLRAQTAMRLQRDLGINLAGVALALDLMNEVEELQTLVKRSKSNG